MIMPLIVGGISAYIGFKIGSKRSQGKSWQDIAEDGARCTGEAVRGTAAVVSKAFAKKRKPSDEVIDI